MSVSVRKRSIRAFRTIRATFPDSPDINMEVDKQRDRVRKMIAPWKINIEPENHWVVEESSLPSRSMPSGSMWVSSRVIGAMPSTSITYFWIFQGVQ